jgi:hypothetical protein
VESVAAALVLSDACYKVGPNKSFDLETHLIAKTSVLSSLEMLPVHRHIRLSLFKNGIDVFSIGRSRAGESGVSQHLPDDERHAQTFVWQR